MSIDPDRSLKLLLTPREAAHSLRVSERTLWSLTDRGELPVVRIGRSVRYRATDLEAFAERLAKGGQPV